MPPKNHNSQPPYDYTEWDDDKLNRTGKKLMDELKSGRLPEDALEEVDRDLGHLVFELYQRKHPRK